MVADVLLDNEIADGHPALTKLFELDIISIKDISIVDVQIREAR